MHANFDYIVVGAGAAGSVLANRLTASGRSKVLLIEAGSDVVPGREPSDIRNVFPISAFNETYMWPDTFVHWRTEANSPPVFLQQGKIMGGSSNLMGMWALRGRPEDYDEWESCGARGWGWSDVLPYFKALENDIDFGGPLHGKEGPLQIRHEGRQEWSAIDRSAHRIYLRRSGYHVDDANADFRDGHFSVPISRYENTRASAGICYLTQSVRARPNLQVLTDRTVRRLTLEGRRVTRVIAQFPDGSERAYAATETLVTAGALKSPVLLMRSGIGPSSALQDAGIDPIVDLPGVGQNLQNHFMLLIVAMLRRGALGPSAWRPAGATSVRWSSGLPGTPPSDMTLAVRSSLVCSCMFCF